MSIREIHQRAAAILLLAVLLVVNTFPFRIRSGTSAEVVFIALAAIHAELCLICAWCLCHDGVGRLERWLWSGLGFVAATLAGTALLSGHAVSLSPWRAPTVGLVAVVPAGCIAFGVFLASKRFLGLRLANVPPTRSRGEQFPLRRLCLFVAACGYASLLTRQLATPPAAGWRLEDSPDAFLLAGMQSVVVGILAAPGALVVLKPNRFGALWIAYFVGVCALEPLAEWAVATRLRIGSNNPPVPWPELYASVVIDNLTWYGPQLIPTVVLFVLLRWSGVRWSDARVVENE